MKSSLQNSLRIKPRGKQKTNFNIAWNFIIEQYSAYNKLIKATVIYQTFGDNG